MEAFIKINLTHGLTQAELGAFIDASAARQVEVDTVVMEALREGARRLRVRLDRQRRTEMPQEPAA